MTAVRRRRERDVILLAAAIRGCNCRPDIRHRKSRGGIRHIGVHHDDSCPVVDSPPQLLLQKTPRR